MDLRGNILAAISKDSFKEAFRLTRDGDKYGGSLAVANEVKDIVGEAQVLITVYKDCKMMLLPIPSYEILLDLYLSAQLLLKIIASLIRLKSYWQRETIKSQG